MTTESQLAAVHDPDELGGLPDIVDDATHGTRVADGEPVTGTPGAVSEPCDRGSPRNLKACRDTHRFAGSMCSSSHSASASAIKLSARTRPASACLQALISSS